MFEPQATESEMDAFGFRPQDYAHEVVTYWPDTEAAVMLFSSVATQWRGGIEGRIGLDYCAVYPLMDRMRLAPDDWDALFLDLRVLENAALETMHEARR